MLRKNSPLNQDGAAAKPMLTVSKTRCPQNHPCPSTRVCPVGALHQKGFDAPSVDLDICIRCGKYVRFCPMRALVLE